LKCFEKKTACSNLLESKDIPQVNLQGSVQVTYDDLDKEVEHSTCFAVLYRRLGVTSFLVKVPCNKTYFASFGCDLESAFVPNETQEDSFHIYVNQSIVLLPPLTNCPSGWGHTFDTNQCTHLIPLKQALFLSLNSQLYNQVCQDHGLSPYKITPIQYNELMKSSSFLHYKQYDVFVVTKITSISSNDACSAYMYTDDYIIHNTEPVKDCQFKSTFQCNSKCSIFLICGENRTLWKTNYREGLNMFTCYDGSFIPGARKCDGIRDCQHGEDEKECSHIYKGNNPKLSDELSNSCQYIYIPTRKANACHIMT
jgi:hypothetical protein